MKSGFVTIIGRPNAGKSTLLNALVGAKLAIVTHKPQTTRNRILGVVNLRPKQGRAGAQIILIDTPGVHRPNSKLNEKMMREVLEGMEGADLVLHITDATERFGAGEQATLDLLKKAGTPAFLLLNKIDLLEAKQALLPLIEQWRQRHDYKEIFPISALRRDGLDALLDSMVGVLPEGPEYFPRNQVTDQPERFLAAEIIREQLLLATEEEVPYATTVVIEQWDDEPKITRISAVIFCEREGQKAIIIGKGGQKLKQIGSAARLQIEDMLKKKVFLELFVKVRANWRESREFVEGLDWRKQLESLVRPSWE